MTQTPSKAKVSSKEEKPTNWLSLNPSKRRGEIFFLKWSVIWIGIMAYIVASRIFEIFTAESYMVVGLIIGIPPIVIPFLFPGDDADIPWRERYTTKANIFVFILAWTSNYLWTHYFYNVLGTSYTFPAWRFNDVPFCLYLITHSYFATYHVFSTIVIRKAWQFFNNKLHASSFIFVSIVIIAMSYFVAFAETFTIQNFPYYVIPDQMAMYVFGSVFYALYFVVSFPMFYRMDENVGENWSCSRAFFEGWAACGLITQALDLWRLGFGPISNFANINSVAHPAAAAVTNSNEAMAQAEISAHPASPNKVQGVPFVY